MTHADRSKEPLVLLDASQGPRLCLAKAELVPLVEPLYVLGIWGLDARDMNNPVPFIVKGPFHILEQVIRCSRAGRRGSRGRRLHAK